MTGSSSDSGEGLFLNFRTPCEVVDSVDDLGEGLF